MLGSIPNRGANNKTIFTLVWVDAATGQAVAKPGGSGALDEGFFAKPT